ncbi:sensory rhodopsin transducer [Jiella sonneratiae]|uniref:Sensory rhodopsin transducer n=1 Tax=Jiella sonneratiae TaxID=2816856 RepID=A0ABS3IZS8_9HYPH|nr:sensory rhodopsin transducer [Jiella sonneratiae]MBO0902228.1 sensory rhodopsin transducer [Jiella sonneratiae]
MDIGTTTWALAEGYVPSGSFSQEHDLVSHEALCVLNAGKSDAEIEILLYFADREPVGPYRLKVPAERTRHFRFNDLEDPEPLPRDTAFSSVITSNVPVVLQHTRLDSRDPHIALLSTVPYSA